MEWLAILRLIAELLPFLINLLGKHDENGGKELIAKIDELNNLVKQHLEV